MHDDPGSEHNRAPLHHTTRTSHKAPAIFEYRMKQLQTSPHSLRAMVETHLFSLCFKESNKTLDLPLEQG